MSDGAVIDRIVGRGLPVRGNDIDTDRIIPARYLREITFEGLGPHAFEDDRRALDGAHPLDDPRFAGAGVLVVNRNFGCGSSREHAPQALLRRGIRAIVGESFAEIFFGNCVTIGLPCITMDPEHVESLQALLDEAPDAELVIDVEAERVVTDQGAYPATVPASARASFLTGRWDALGQLLENTDEVRATSARLPYLTGFGGGPVPSPLKGEG